MLVPVKDLLRIAEVKNIAIPAFNITSLSVIQAVIEAAEEEGQPIIIEFAIAHEEEKITTLDFIGPVMVMMAERASVPVAVHLDHGLDFDYIKRALDLGFTSVMYDGSALPLEENIANTALAVKIAREYGASVEAEIGKMAGLTFTNDRVLEDRDIDRSMYTDPAEAKYFVENTGIDCLACSFGTSHGLYKKPPKLDVDLVAEIREQTGVPLVMHGGSGVSDDDYRAVIEAGVRKVNYYSYMAKAAGEHIRATIPQEGPLFFHEIEVMGREKMKAHAKNAIRIFNNTL